MNGFLNPSLRQVSQTGFEIVLPARIIYGRGKAKLTIPELARLGRHTLLVHGTSTSRSNWLVDALQQLDIGVTTLTCGGEPDIEMLEAGILSARKNKTDCVIALGGGAVIDFGKAIAALAPAEGNIFDYLEVVGKGLPLVSAPLPFAALPTTAGTGAEVTKNSVIAVPQHQRKVSLRDNRMLADIAVIDPALTDNCPPMVTLASGLDAITQVIEPYLSCKANPFTDSLCAGAIPAGLAALRKLMDGEDREARDQMAWTSLCGGIALANSGLGAVHGFAGVIGGMTGAPHGEICACLLPQTLRINLLAMELMSKNTARINQVKQEIDLVFGDVEGTDAFDRLHNWSRQHGIRSISQLGVSETDFVKVSEQSLSSSSMKGNPVALEVSQLLEILARS